MTVKSKKKYPTVKATNGCEFVLGATMRGIPISSPGFTRGTVYDSTREQIREALRSPDIAVRYCNYNTGQAWWPTTFRDQRERGSALALGCMNFNKSDAAKIRKWAKGGK